MRGSVYVAFLGFLADVLHADPVPVRFVQGIIHGYVVLKDLDDKILASGDVRQLPAASRVTMILILHFKDGSFYEETSVYSQQKAFHLLSYKRVMKGPAFKMPGTLLLNTSTGVVSVQYVDKDGKEKSTTDRLSLPSDLANGIISTLISNIDPKVEATLSLLTTTPKPRIVKLTIAASGEDSFFVGGVSSKAIHYIVKIDLGGVIGVAAKVVGKQPQPIQIWMAAGDAPIVVKSEALCVRMARSGGWNWRALSGQRVRQSDDKLPK
jgi:hypothetical protein